MYLYSVTYPYYTMMLSKKANNLNMIGFGIISTSFNFINKNTTNLFHIVKKKTKLHNQFNSLNLVIYLN